MSKTAAATPSTPIEAQISLGSRDTAVRAGLPIQYRWRRVEFAVWILLTAFFVLDLVGVVGRGYLAQTRIETSDGSLQLQYEPVERWGKTSVLKVQVGPANRQRRTWQLWVSENVGSELGAWMVRPQPVRSVADRGGVLYTLAGTALTGSAELALQPRRPGLWNARLRVPGQEEVKLRILVMP